LAPAPHRIDLLGFAVTELHAGHDGRFSLLRWDAPPGAGGIPLHVHAHTEEGFYVLEGQLGLRLDEEELVRGPGSYTVVAPGRRHAFWNPGERAAAYLTLIAPAGFGRYFRELADGLARSPSADEAAALRRRLGEVHDIEVVGPPPH
jgi:mannose-6-phosphate isomerase-like protein (cupin superfamily)